MFIPRLREHRENQGLSQQELADRSGISVATISRIESKERPVNPPTARKLANALGLHPKDLKAEEVPA